MQRMDVCWPDASEWGCRDNEIRFVVTVNGVVVQVAITENYIRQGLGASEPDLLDAAKANAGAIENEVGHRLALRRSFRTGDGIQL